MFAKTDNGEKLEFQLLFVVEPDEDGYHAFCPALKGLHTSGSTEQEALDNAKDAAVAYILSLIKHGDPIPLGARAAKTGRRALWPCWQKPGEYTERVALPMR